MTPLTTIDSRRTPDTSTEPLLSRINRYASQIMGGRQEIALLAMALIAGEEVGEKMQQQSISENDAPVLVQAAEADSSFNYEQIATGPSPATETLSYSEMLTPYDQPGYSTMSYNMTLEPDFSLSVSTLEA